MKTRITIYVLTAVIVAMGIGGIFMTNALFDKDKQITALSYQVDSQSRILARTAWIN